MKHAAVVWQHVIPVGQRSADRQLILCFNRLLSLHVHHIRLHLLELALETAKVSPQFNILHINLVVGSRPNIVVTTPNS